MTTYPYTYLASFMNPEFQQAVVAQALRHAAKSGGAARQRLEWATRNAGVPRAGVPAGQDSAPAARQATRYAGQQVDAGVAVHDERGDRRAHLQPVV